MAGLPMLSGRDLLKIFVALGYNITHMRGSHMRLHHPTRKPITIPNYKSISKGLLRKILRQSNMSVKEFLDLISSN